METCQVYNMLLTLSVLYFLCTRMVYDLTGISIVLHREGSRMAGPSPRESRFVLLRQNCDLS